MARRGLRDGARGTAAAGALPKFQQVPAHATGPSLRKAQRQRPAVGVTREDDGSSVGAWEVESQASPEVGAAHVRPRELDDTTLQETVEEGTGRAGAVGGGAEQGTPTAASSAAQHPQALAPVDTRPPDARSAFGSPKGPSSKKKQKANQRPDEHAAARHATSSKAASSRAVGAPTRVRAIMGSDGHAKFLPKRTFSRGELVRARRKGAQQRATTPGLPGRRMATPGAMEHELLRRFGGEHGLEEDAKRIAAARKRASDARKSGVPSSAAAVVENSAPWARAEQPISALTRDLQPGGSEPRRALPAVARRTAGSSSSLAMPKVSRGVRQGNLRRREPQTTAHDTLPATATSSASAQPAVLARALLADINDLSRRHRRIRTVATRSGDQVSLRKLDRLSSPKTRGDGFAMRRLPDVPAYPHGSVLPPPSPPSPVEPRMYTALVTTSGNQLATEMPVPPTGLPARFFEMGEASLLFDTAEGGGPAAFDTKEGKFQRVLFPSNAPSTREEARYLSRVLDAMMDEIRDGNFDRSTFAPFDVPPAFPVVRRRGSPRPGSRGSRPGSRPTTSYSQSMASAVKMVAVTPGSGRASRSASRGHDVPETCDPFPPPPQGAGLDELAWLDKIGARARLGSSSKHEDAGGGIPGAGAEVGTPEWRDDPTAERASSSGNSSNDGAEFSRLRQVLEQTEMPQPLFRSDVDAARVHDIAGFSPEVKAEVSALNVVLYELVRHVFTQCEERGRLLERLRVRIMEVLGQADLWCEVQTKGRFETEARWAKVAPLLHEAKRLETALRDQQAAAEEAQRQAAKEYEALFEENMKLKYIASHGSNSDWMLGMQEEVKFMLEMAEGNSMYKWSEAKQAAGRKLLAQMMWRITIRMVLERRRYEMGDHREESMREYMLAGGATDRTMIDKALRHLTPTAENADVFKLKRTETAASVEGIRVKLRRERVRQEGDSLSDVSETPREVKEIEDVVTQRDVAARGRGADPVDNGDARQGARAIHPNEQRQSETASTTSGPPASTSSKPGLIIDEPGRVDVGAIPASPPAKASTSRAAARTSRRRSSVTLNEGQSGEGARGRRQSRRLSNVSVSTPLRRASVTSTASRTMRRLSQSESKASAGSEHSATKKVTASATDEQITGHAEDNTEQDVEESAQSSPNDDEEPADEAPRQDPSRSDESDADTEMQAAPIGGKQKARRNAERRKSERRKSEQGKSERGKSERRKSEQRKSERRKTERRKTERRKSRRPSVASRVTAVQSIASSTTRDPTDEAFESGTSSEHSMQSDSGGDSSDDESALRSSDKGTASVHDVASERRASRASGSAATHRKESGSGVATSEGGAVGVGKDSSVINAAGAELHSGARARVGSDRATVVEVSEVATQTDIDMVGMKRTVRRASISLRQHRRASTGQVPHDGSEASYASVTEANSSDEEGGSAEDDFTPEELAARARERREQRASMLAQGSSQAAKARRAGKFRSPGGWSAFLKGFKGKSVRPMVPRQTVALILTIYQDKTKADAVDLREGTPIDTMPEFCTNYLLFKFGTRKLVQQRLSGFLKGVRSMFKKDKLVRIFARFCGMVDPLPVDCLTPFLQALDIATCEQPSAAGKDLLAQKYPKLHMVVKGRRCLDALRSVAAVIPNASAAKAEALLRTKHLIFPEELQSGRGPAAKRRSSVAMETLGTAAAALAKSPKKAAKRADTPGAPRRSSVDSSGAAMSSTAMAKVLGLKPEDMEAAAADSASEGPGEAPDADGGAEEAKGDTADEAGVQPPLPASLGALGGKKKGALFGKLQSVKSKLGIGKEQAAPQIREETTSAFKAMSVAARAQESSRQLEMLGALGVSYVDRAKQAGVAAGEKLATVAGKSVKEIATAAAEATVAKYKEIAPEPVDFEMYKVTWKKATVAGTSAGVKVAGKLTDADMTPVVVAAASAAAAIMDLEGGERENRAARKLQAIFRGRQARRKIKDMLAPMNDFAKSWIDVADFMMVFVSMWTTAKETSQTKVRRFFLESDENGDGVLELHEFIDLVGKIAEDLGESAGASVHLPEPTIKRMYLQTLKKSQSDAISIEVFSDVVQDFMYAAVIDEIRRATQRGQAAKAGGSEVVSERRRSRRSSSASVTS